MYHGSKSARIDEKTDHVKFIEELKADNNRIFIRNMQLSWKSLGNSQMIQRRKNYQKLKARAGE
jgi:hypothetical protein